MDDNTNNLLVSVSHHSPATVDGNGELLGEGRRQDHGPGSPGDPTEDQPMEEDEESMEAPDENPVPDNVRAIIRGLIDHYQLSRDQFAAVYDEYAKIKYSLAAAEQTDGCGGGEQGSVGEEQKEDGEEDGLRLHVVEEPTLARVAAECGGNDGIGSNGSAIQIVADQQLQGEVNRLQSVVQSAMETYVSSPVVANTATRRTLALSDDPLPSTFARELLQRDQSLVAQAIRKYLHQYSIPQREVVEKTGINQSHLSQHFTRGVPIKPAKRVKLYHWFEQDQLQRTGKLLTADGSLTSVLESPKVEGYRRRPRWRWSPVATQILTEAFKKNRFPTREQRLELSRICNEAESAMNNGEPLQGPSGDTEGITEQRINTWFTNRRKGLVTPSPTAETFGSLSGLSILQSPNASLETPTSELTLSSSATTPIRQQQMVTTSPLNIPINLTASTTSAASNAASDSISLTAPLALSPINLQTLLSQLQVQSNAAPTLAQNLGQILVGQLPQGVLNLESLVKQFPVVDPTSLTNDTNPSRPHAGSDEGEQGIVRGSPSLAVVSEEEIISHTAQPSAVNSRQS